MTNPVQPQACEILSVKKESRHEWTFRVATDAKPAHGQFMQLSIPMIGEAPISVSAQGDGWLEFTIRSVGKVTNVIFEKEAGDTLFLRGPYGKGWPVEQFRGKHLVVITGGTGLAVNDNYTENTPKEVQDKITELSEKIASGEIKVSTAYGMETDEITALRDGVKP